MGNAESTTLNTIATVAAFLPGPLALIAAPFAIFGGIVAKHQAAIRAEASNLNQAVPAFQVELKTIVDAINADKLTQQQALTQVDGAVSDYYGNVSAIIKKSGPCPSPGKRPGTCNGPCAVGCESVEVWANALKQVIQNGGGTANLSSSSAHAGYQGAPALSLTVQRLSGSLQGSGSSGGSKGITGLLSGLSPWMVIAGVGAIALLATSGGKH